MYLNILDDKRIELLKNISETVSISDYYMIGGTALSLQLGLRESFDFDFCVREKFNNTLLIEELKSIGEVKILQNSQGTCDVLLNNVQVSFFYYPNKVLEDFKIYEEIPNLKIASILDISAMKLSAISGRGSKKDFFDLYNILQKTNITIQDVSKAFILKDNNSSNYFGTVISLTYFEDADEQELPNCFINYDWNEIKLYFIKNQSVFDKYIKENLKD